MVPVKPIFAGSDEFQVFGPIVEPVTVFVIDLEPCMDGVSENVTQYEPVSHSGTYRTVYSKFYTQVFPIPIGIATFCSVVGTPHATFIVDLQTTIENRTVHLFRGL